MFTWIKKLKAIVATYYVNLDALHSRIDKLDALVRDRTDISVDVSMTRKNPSQVIVTGQYRNSDYVQVFNVDTDDLALLIDMLRDMQRHGVVRRVDAPIGFKAVFNRELHGF